MTSLTEERIAAAINESHPEPPSQRMPAAIVAVTARVPMRAHDNEGEHEVPAGTRGRVVREFWKAEQWYLIAWPAGRTMMPESAMVRTCSLEFAGDTRPRKTGFLNQLRTIVRRERRR